MPTLCRAFPTVDEARSAVERLLAAGHPGEEIRLLTGTPARDVRDAPVGSFAGAAGAAETVGTFAGGERSRRAARGAFAGGGDMRRGSFADLDREMVEDYEGGVRHVRVAGHRDLRRMLVDAGLDEPTADADVEALHEGRVVVLVRADGTGEAAIAALEV
jgi:hypothetical protein